ncbi:hypothetical protein BsWGS_03789 [Bradybaena similaris]
MSCSAIKHQETHYTEYIHTYLVLPVSNMDVYINPQAQNNHSRDEMPKKSSWSDITRQTTKREHKEEIRDRASLTIYRKTNKMVRPHPEDARKCPTAQGI